jgi:hypothetical protein
MQNQAVSQRTRAGKALLSLVVMMLALVIVVPVSAQTEPTFTPADPLTRAFSAVRSAIEIRFNTDLTVVRNWEWEQVEFTGGGIDACTVAVEAPRALYFGWRFVITDLAGRQYEGRSSFDSTIITTCDEVTAPAATAPSTGSTDPNLPPPVGGSAAVGAFELGGHYLELNPNTVSLARRSGMTWVKYQVRHQNGADPSIAQGAITAAQANGFKILIAIPVDLTAMAANFDGYIPTYASFVAGIAGLGANAIEVGNEPNIDREWPANLINGANYTRLLAASFNAIKTTNPNVLVISGAPAPTGFFGAGGCGAGGCNDDVFMQQMAAAGAAQYMDCVGLHYNEGILAPSASSGDSRGSYPTYFFGSMLNRGYSLFGGKPVCWTELGYLSPEGFSTPLPGAFAWAQNTTVAQQAAWIAEAATLSATSGRVRLMIVWNLDFPFWGADPAAGFAIFRPNGTCPGCDSLGAVMSR